MEPKSSKSLINFPVERPLLICDPTVHPNGNYPEEKKVQEAGEGLIQKTKKGWKAKPSGALALGRRRDVVTGQEKRAPLGLYTWWSGRLRRYRPMVWTVPVSFHTFLPLVLLPQTHLLRKDISLFCAYLKHMVPEGWQEPCRVI